MLIVPCRANRSRAPCRRLAVEGLEQRWLLSTLLGTEAVEETTISPETVCCASGTDCCELSVAMLAVSGSPVAEDDWANILPGQELCLPVLDNDSDDGQLVPSSVEVVKGPETGQVEVNAETGVICYTVGGHFDGVDQFEYVVADNDGNFSNAALVTIVCWQNPENRLDINDDGCLAPIDMLCLVNRLNAMPGDCSLPDLGNTPPMFCDASGDGLISPVDALIVVNALNLPAPTTASDWAVTQPDESVEIPILANDCGPGGGLDASSVVIVMPAGTGVVSVDEWTGLATYTPSAEFDGVDHFAYTVQDCNGRIAPAAQVTIVSWQNPENRYNVDGQDGVSPADVLCVMNWLDAHPGDSSLPPIPLVPPPFYDVTGDMLITPADLLCVWNALDAQSREAFDSESIERLRSLDEFMAELSDEGFVWDVLKSDADVL